MWALCVSESSCGQGPLENWWLTSLVRQGPLEARYPDGFAETGSVNPCFKREFVAPRPVCCEEALVQELLLEWLEATTRSIKDRCEVGEMPGSRFYRAGVFVACVTLLVAGQREGSGSCWALSLAQWLHVSPLGWFVSCCMAACAVWKPFDRTAFARWTALVCLINPVALLYDAWCRFCRVQSCSGI